MTPESRLQYASCYVKVMLGYWDDYGSSGTLTGRIALYRCFGPKNEEHRLGGKNFWTQYLRAQMKFLVKIFFLHHVQHLNFTIEKDLGQSDRWKKTGTHKNSEPVPSGQSLRNRLHMLLNLLK